MALQQRGFTLIEALVALTIIAVALMACLKAASNLNVQQDAMLKRQYAQWSARNVANGLLVSGVFPAANQTAKKTCDQADVALTCLVSISATPNPNFRRIEIQVKDSFALTADHQMARLVLFLSNAP